MSQIPPLRREVAVNADPDVAYRVFTDRIGQWWPLAEHGVYGEGASVSFEGDEIVEVSPAGERSVWGTVTDRMPAERLAFTWHPGRDRDSATEVTVTFARSGEQTLVTLVHTGWEVYADPAAAREEYGHGWPTVLARFRQDVDRSGADGRDSAATWVALIHRPGPEAPPGPALFSAPQFAQHLEFLDLMQAKGYLVAAGPLLDSAGDGMTILRLPGADRLEEATALASKEDASVAGGFFTVEVRPWQVMLEGTGPPC